jgi:plastocyanin
MRVTAMVAGVAMMLVACGGEKAPEAPAAEAAPVAEAPAAATTGTTHEVQMIQEGMEYKYVPAALTIKAGDTVIFKSVSGGLHNVQFYADSIVPGSSEMLDAAITNKQGPLASALVGEGDSITITFPAGLPAGDYKFFCLPHQTMGMHGVITVAAM